MQLLAADRQPCRTPWGDTQPVAILASETLTKHHGDYIAAKAGEIRFAMAMVRDLIDRRGVKRKIGTLLKHRDPLIVPVHAVEAHSVNVIPTALAETVSGDFDLRVNYDILQANRVSHTGSSGYHRLATPPLFAGDVIVGEDYLIVDDFVGQGALWRISAATSSSTAGTSSAWLHRHGGADRTEAICYNRGCNKDITGLESQA